MVEDARAGPGHGEGGEQQAVGEVDGDQVGRGAVQAEQHD
jgi:hypothetical protein